MGPGEIVQSRYELERPLGRGGMAEVWRAKDVRLGRPVAVKFLAPQFAEDPEFLVRFFTEAQSVARLAHHNIVKVLDFGEFDGRPYLVMEYVPGGSLDDINGAVMPERALEIVEQAALGAGAAHRMGIVHRDIKPANILLDDEGRPKLADFGIATPSGGERMTETGQAIGSPHYISPEQVSGRSATPASDVYSLGIVLYVLLTGRRPFERDNVTAVAISQVEDQPLPPSVHNPDVDEDLDALVMHCLDKDPAQRFGDGNALAAAIASGYRADDGSDERPEQEAAGGRTRRAVVVAFAAVALLALLGAGFYELTNPGPPAESAEANDEPSSTPSKRKKARATPTPTAPAPVTDATSAPSPTESETAEPADKKRAPGGEPDETPVDEPTEPAPTPEPTAPTPEPTSSPDGTISGGGGPSPPPG
ncbi:MAG: serine/threonine-protein kinase [Actinomycetota bacterium]